MINFFRKTDEKKKFGESILQCPRCKKGMDKIKRAEIIIDTCRKCGGIWLDDNEINKLVQMKNNDKTFKKNNNTIQGGKKKNEKERR